MNTTQAQDKILAAPMEGIVDAEHHGDRADKALLLLLPGSSLRRRRRVFETHTVRVDGRPVGAGHKVFQGQSLVAVPLQAGGEELPAPDIRIVKQNADYAALYKPAGMHSAAIAGRPGVCVEGLLPGMFPGGSAQLLNRLDYLTSGLLLVAKNKKAAKAYLALKAGAVRKEYLAVVHGKLAEELSLRFMLDTDDRKRTRIVAKMNQDANGWTIVKPESALAHGRTLVRVRIVEGARHQIRAHLAFAGLPIMGDPLYGVEGDAAPRLYLHHALLAFPGFRADAAVDWPNPDAVAEVGEMHERHDQAGDAPAAEE